MHSLKECFDPKWVEWDKPWNFQQSWILYCVLFLEYVFFMELTGVLCRPTNAYQSLLLKSLCFWISVDPSECILNAFWKTEIELDMDLIQFQEWHTFADKAIIWFMCSCAHSSAPVNPELTGILLQSFRYIQICEGRLKWGNVYCIFSEVKKGAVFSCGIDFHSCTTPAVALSYCYSNSLSIN